VIITRISGGLGNQMFQYAMAKAMAKKNGDNFKLDISFYPQQALRKYELNLFNIEENIATEGDSKELRGREGLLFKIKNKFGIHTKRPLTYIKEKIEWLSIFQKDTCDLKGDIYLDGFWQHENYFKDIKSEISKEFTLKQQISNEAKEYLSDIQKSQSISLHVRRGDYVQNIHTNRIHGTCDLEYYNKSIEHINNKINSPIFFIFSDDMSWCQENFNFLDNKVFVDDTQTAFDDLELMQNCKHNIIANSTFSWWGAWLNKNENKIVVSPKFWASSNLNITLSCKEWIKI
jgi:hypothetical protein